MVGGGPGGGGGVAEGRRVSIRPKESRNMKDGWGKNEEFTTKTRGVAPTGKVKLRQKRKVPGVQKE